MLDLKDLRQDPDRYRAALATRGPHAERLERILDLDQRAREAQAECQDLQARANQLSKEIDRLRKAGDASDVLMGEARTNKARVGELNAGLRDLEQRRADELAWLPNLPHASAPVGDESVNRELVDRAWGEPRLRAGWDFAPQAHWDLGEQLGVLSMERGARLAGSGFSLLLGLGARLERALISFMLDLHTAEHGYTEVWPPLLAQRSVLFGTGQLPKLEDDMYRLERDDLFLVPTAEVQLTNLHRDETLAESELPRRYCAYTACFRREAGAAGRDTRGLIRLHQFDKVELVKLVRPEESAEQLESMLDDACQVLKRLDLPYRILELSTEDMSFASHRTYDIEVYSPGVDRWLEVSSVSNCLDFQARRAMIRYKPAGGGKPRFVHSLNGSGTALPRVVVAILENFQREDGTVIVPEALRGYVGREVLERA